ncbi:FabG Dehydrogenases with different specificities (related to short-chain alcohol dehydrogenases) [Spirosomataceae bacterium]
MNTKIAVITGGTSGIGKATVEKLVTFGTTVVLLARDIQKAELVKKEILKTFPNGKIDIFSGDLKDLNSIKSAADDIKVKYPQIDILINNAGGVFSEFEKTMDGFEVGFQVNHLAHFLLTQILLDNLLKSEESRVINLSSEAHRVGKFSVGNLNAEKKFGTWKQYGATKLMNILFTKALANKFGDKGLLSFAVHPGVVKSGFGANNTGFLKYFNKMPFLITPEKGAETSVYLATQTKEKLSNGGYYKRCQISYSSLESQDIVAQDQLWEISMKMIKTYL